ncbi:MAG: hypothetical protein ACRD98_02785 [Nitrososphaera sp.]
MSSFVSGKSSVALASALALILVSSIFTYAYAYSPTGWGQLGIDMGNRNLGSGSFGATAGEIGLISFSDDEDDEEEDEDEEEHEEDDDDDEKSRGSSGKGHKNKEKDHGNSDKSKDKGNQGKHDDEKDDDDDERDDDDDGKPSMLRRVPSSLNSFELVADGIALAKRDGRDGPFTDASLEIRAIFEREEGNHFRFHATGTVELEDNGEYDIVDAKGIIIFFKNLRGSKSVAGLLHIGGSAIDEDGNNVGKFRLRALVLGEEDNEWRVIVFPAAKLGPHIRLVNMDGTITGLAGVGGSPPPASTALHHFKISSIPSPISSGSPFNVTVTAQMSNGTILKSYDGKAKISDLSGSVKPIITPKFQNGVFKGALNITEAISSDKVTFSDTETGKNGTSNSFSVLAGPLAKVDLSPSNVTLGPGGAATFTAKGFDMFGNEISGLVFLWSLSSSDFGSISTSGNKANFTASSTITSNGMVNLTASVGALADTSQISISPTATQLLDHFVFGNISSPQTAGSPFTITVRAVNSSGATITGYSGPMMLTDTTGALNTTVSAGFSGGIWTGTVNITEAADDVKITAKDTVAPSKTGSSNEFDVIAGSLNYFEIGSIGNQTAGSEFNVLVTAKDAFGNTKKDYQGNVTLSTNNGASPAGNVTLFVPSTYNFTATDEGQHTFKATMYNAKEDVTITASGSGKSGTSNEFDVLPAAVADVTVSPTSATVSPGGAAVFSAEAQDSYGNEVEGAEFEWTLDTASLGTLDIDPDTSSVEFLANSSILVTTSGNLSANVGSISDSAGITVSV